MNLLDLLYQNTSIYSFYYNFGLLISLVIAFFFSFIYVKTIKYFQIKEYPKYTAFIFVIPFFTIFLLTNISNYFDLMQKNKYLILLILGLFLSNIIVIIIFFVFINSINMKKEIDFLHYKEEVFNMKYDLLEQHYNNNFNFLHNLLHDCVDLKQSLIQEDNIEIENKVEKIINTTYKEFNAIYTNSNVINNIINSYMNDIKKYNVEIKSIIQCNEFYPLQGNNLVELFSTLLDLSISGCKTVNNERIIILKTNRNNHQIFIQVIYSCLNNNNEKILFVLKQILDNSNYNISIRDLDENKKSVIIYYSTNTIYERI